MSRPLPATKRDALNFERISLLFKGMSTETRLAILFCLSDGERNVSELAEYLGMDQTAVSHQLTHMRYANLLRARRDGRNVYYRLKDESITEILRLGEEVVAR
ncbi:MAG: ArsR family transcriptional regulator [Acholeplasmatales bacterium]|nr:MAG: ArsR family transcriptional regulator [Acholeplasmatales bacterium]